MMEVGLGSLSPEHRAELARAHMTVVPIPRSHVTGLGQSASPGTSNVPNPPGGRTQPFSDGGVQGQVASVTATVLGNIPGIVETTNAAGTGPAPCPGALQLVYMAPSVQKKFNLAPITIANGLSQQQLAQIYYAYVADSGGLQSTAAVATPGSNYSLPTTLSFTYNGIPYVAAWRRYGNDIAATILACLPHAPPPGGIPLVPAPVSAVAPVTPATSSTWLWILGAVVVGGLVIYAVD